MNNTAKIISKKDIANLVVSLGFRSDISGYNYLVDGINIVLGCYLNGEDMPNMEYVYNQIASQSANLSYSKIERCVRYLIEEWVPNVHVYDRPCKELVENILASNRLYPRTLIFSLANYLLYNYTK